MKYTLVIVALAALLCTQATLLIGCKSRNASAEPLGEPPIMTESKPPFQATATGLQYRVLEEGSGRVPTSSSTVTVHYKGWLDDQTTFDSSYSRGPATFPLNGVVKGWTEGLQLVGEGGTIELIVPSDLGYGKTGSPPKIPPDATLHFLVELIAVE